MKYNYGNSWEKYPIEENEIWISGNGSKITVQSIFNSLPYFFHYVDMLYIDPPWNLSNLNSFYTKAEKSDYIDKFEDFYSVLFKRITEINCRVCYVEIGEQNKNVFFDKMKSIFPCVNIWKVTYYKKHESYLIRGSVQECVFDFSGMDDSTTPQKAIEIENINSVGDLCAGRGLTGISAHSQNKIFYGMELNKRRLAVMIDKLGGIYEKG
jgi:adenine specific DNA methylase Mod